MIIDELKKLIKDTTHKAGLSVGVFDVDYCENNQFGDLSTNIALVSASKNKIKPEQFADKLVKHLPESKMVTSPEYKNGFLNFKYRKSYLTGQIREILEQGEGFGKLEYKKNKKMMVEFVSANPTGELHIGNLRGGPIGQTIANLAQNFGYKVKREYYVNDFGVQVEKLVLTLLYHHKSKLDRSLKMTEDLYPSQYIKEVYLEIYREHKDCFKDLPEEALLSLFEKEGLRILICKISDQVKYLGIEYDSWVYESEIINSGKTERAVKLLEEKGYVSNKEGALWFKNPEDPEMLDRETVLKKSDAKGTYTYFANDIAYHLDKFERGFVRSIDVWGANHFGHIPRLNAAMRALGVPDDFLKIILYQNVRLKEGGEAVQMSKRKGNTITVADLIKEGINPDVFKFMMISTANNSVVDFDLKLAKDTSEKNPVFYLKYAHARICSLLKKAGNLGEIKGDKGKLGGEKGREAEEEKSTLASNNGQEGTSERLASEIDLKEKEELALAKELLRYQTIITSSFSELSLQRLPHYALELATAFHHFYDRCQIIGEPTKIKNSRLLLCQATKVVLKNLLDLMSIEAPEKM